MQIRVFPKVYPLDLYGNIRILQGSDLRICIKIRIFPRVDTLDLYGNTIFYKGLPLGAASKYVISKGMSFGFVWKYAYFTRG